MSEINTPEQAKQALAEIRRAAEANDGRIGQMEQAVQAVRDSVRAMSEEVNRAKMAGQSQTASEREIVERYTYEQGGEKAVRMTGETGRDGVYRTGLLDDQTTYSDWQRRLQQLVTRRSLVRLFAGARGSESFARSPQCDHDIAQHLRAAPVGFQRIFGDGSNIGAEWIPDVTLPEVDRYVTAGRRVEALFRVMPMSDKTVIMPKLTVGLRPYLKGASVIDDPAQYTIIKATDRNAAVHGVAFNFDDMAVKAGQYLDKVRAEAAAIVARAEKDAEAVRRRAEAEGRQAGQRAVEETVRQQLGQQLATLMPALQQAIEEIRHAKQDWLTHWERSAVHVAAAIAGRLVRREAPRLPEVTVTLLREALELAAGSSEVRIQLNPADHKTLLPQVQALLQELSGLGGAEVLADPGVSRGGCRVQTRFGTIDQQFETQLQRIEEELT